MKDTIRPAGSFALDVLEQFYPDENKPSLFRLTWDKMAGFQFALSALTVWTGFNGHGKSLFLNQILLSALLGDQKGLIASFEMPAKKTIYRMIRQAVGIKDPDADHIFRCLEWLDKRVWIYDKMGTVNPKDMIGRIEAAIHEHGITHVVIDSLMKCGIDVDDLNAQKRFVDGLQNFAQKNPCHVHLVAHARKDRDETQVPGKMDIKGAGEISDMADNVFSVWRNKPKERKLAEGIIIDLHEFDALLDCSKCREDGEQEKRYGFYYHNPSMQYQERRDREPYRYFLD